MRFETGHLLQQVLVYSATSPPPLLRPPPTSPMPPSPSSWRKFQVKLEEEGIVLKRVRFSNLHAIKAKEATDRDEWVPVAELGSKDCSLKVDKIEVTLANNDEDKTYVKPEAELVGMWLCARVCLFVCGLTGGSQHLNRNTQCVQRRLDLIVGD